MEQDSIDGSRNSYDGASPSKKNRSSSVEKVTNNNQEEEGSDYGSGDFDDQSRADKESEVRVI